MDIKRICQKISEEKDNLVAKAFTCQIASLLLTNGIVPIMTEHSFDDLETITDSDRYKLVYELGITFDSLDTSKHDAKIRADAIEECMSAIVNTESKVFNPCADKEWDVLTLLANRQFEILNILKQLKEKK